MSQFMLFLHETQANFAHYSREDLSKIISKYIGWTEQLQERGQLVSSEKLKDEGGRSLTKDGDTLKVVDGPYTEAAEVIGGYYQVKAANYDEAVEIASTCPHLTYGGRIEVREVDLLE